MRAILISLLVALVAIVIFLPQILTMPFALPLFKYSLEKKFKAEIKIGKVRLTWFGPQEFEQIQFTKPEMKGTIESIESNVPLWSLSQFGNEFFLKNAQITFPQYRGAIISEFYAEVSGHDVQAEGSTQGGHFTLNGKVYSKTDFDLTSQFAKMPTIALDQLTGAGGALLSAAGPYFDLASTVVYNQGEGHLQLNFNAQNLQATLDGEITQDSLLLKKPFNATLHFSPEMSQILGGRVIDAKNPITLTIESAGTSIPIRPFAFDRLEIGPSTLVLGQLVLAKLHPMISLFTLVNRPTLASSNPILWCSPEHFTIDKGIMKVGRMDALIDNTVHLCLWGKIDLSNSELDLRLGITADTLEQVVGVRGLSPKYVLQIPVRGTIRNPSYETGSASAKIASFLAGKIAQISKKTGILGGLLNQFSQIQDDANVPPPNRPFPWEQ